MKARTIAWSMAVLLAAAGATLRAQSVDIGIYRAADSTLEVRTQSAAGVGTLPLSNIVFTIRWAEVYGVSLGAARSSTYSVAKQDSERVSGPYRYQKFAAATAQLVTWTPAQPYTVLAVDVHQTGAGSGSFELVNDAWTGAHNGNFYVEVAGEDRTGAIVAGSADNVALPIALISFSGDIDGRRVLLRWRCAAPATGGFAVERSADAAPWREAGFVDAASDAAPGAARNEYVFADVMDCPGPLPQVLRYRLRCVRPDGTEEYSRVLELRPGSAAGGFQLAAWPNPARGPATAGFLLDAAQRVTLTLADAAGRELRRCIDGQMLDPGWHSAGFDPGALPQGVYLLVLRAGARTATAPLLILH